MSGKIDLTGRKFGRLTVIEEAKNKKDSQILWLCKCECGSETEVRAYHLRKSLAKSCGCISKEKAKNLFVEGTSLRAISPTISKRNKSGVKGVYWHKKKKKWVACIMFRRKNINLGTYDNLEDAAQARKEAEEKYFKPILEKYGKEG